jgi:predicted TIM-barrel fold metal-dependent hydrolase
VSADRPARIVDAHVHLWDPANTEWYPYLSRGPGHAGPGGDASRMNRRFDLDVYRAESAAWPVDKVVNVAAATGQHSVDETLELDRRAEAGQGPDAIVGGLPPTDSPGAAIELIDRQLGAARFRGVRPMGGLDRPVPDVEVLRALAERDLVFELMAHPDQLQAAAVALAAVEDLTVVVEHTGWPRGDTPEERALWSAGIEALAGIGERVHCKLSGLAMPFRSMAAPALAPWLEPAIEAFGVDRCLFASNFPVDAVVGTFDELYATFSAVTAGLDAPSRDALFAANAERVYRL